uniref:C2H2-type domain-containing protein n=1 Tax=Tetradesmus obliquus TaxID=3088 RepID=A0A383VSZ7_TETOB|eukprot:jgi/Sobl393_1/10983/SZX68033.1
MLLQPLVQLLLPAVQHLLDGSAVEAARLPAAHNVVQNRVALVTFTSHRLLDGLFDASNPAQVADVLFDLPVTATAQLETAMRAKVKQLIPAGYVTDARLTDERYQQGAESAAKYALLCTTIVGIDAFVHAAKSGKLRAAAAATGLLQLAPRLHGLLTSSCKCYSATSSKAAEEVYVQDEQGLSHLWTGIKSCSELLAALLSSLSFLAMPADTTPVQHRLSGSSLALQLGPGAAPWLHVAGRILLLLAQLLALLPCKGFQMAAPNADHAQKMWSSITDQLKEQLQTLFLPGVSDAAYATVIGKLLRRAAALQCSWQRWSALKAAVEQSAVVSGEGACWRAVNQWLAVEVASNLQELGEALVAALPQRLCCSSHACCCLDKVSEAAAAAAAVACPRCGAAYCSKVCFESHWKQHKVVCKLAAGGRCK